MAWPPFFLSLIGFQIFYQISFVSTSSHLAQFKNKITKKESGRNIVWYSELKLFSLSSHLNSPTLTLASKKSTLVPNH
jgi:hypothetical protein